MVGKILKVLLLALGVDLVGRPFYSSGPIGFGTVHLSIEKNLAQATGAAIRAAGHCAG